MSPLTLTIADGALMVMADVELNAVIDALMPIACSVTLLLIVAVPYPPASSAYTSPPSATAAIAVSKPRHGCCRVHGFASLPVVDTKVLCGSANAAPEKRKRDREMIRERFIIASLPCWFCGSCGWAHDTRNAPLGTMTREAESAKQLQGGVHPQQKVLVTEAQVV